MIDLIRTYFGVGVSTFTVELTAAVLLIAFICLIVSMVCGILNRFFR